jgi:uncharacterized protein involved in exopolysaccharide biosynthesis
MIKLNKKRNYSSTEAGYAVLELLFYISFFVLLSFVVINAMIVMAKSFRETEIYTGLIQSSTMMEKISRELRQADDFSFASGVLVVNTKDDSNNPKTITYTYASPNIQVSDSVLGSLGNLNASNIAVINFSFTPITTARGKAAVILLTVKDNDDASEREVDFNNTIVLRGDY